MAVASCFFIRAYATCKTKGAAPHEQTLANLCLNQVIGALPLSTKFIVGAGHLLRNLRLERIHLVRSILSDLRGGRGSSWSGAAKAAATTDDIYVNVAGGTIIKRA